MTELAQNLILEYSAKVKALKSLVGKYKSNSNWRLTKRGQRAELNISIYQSLIKELKQKI